MKHPILAALVLPLAASAASPQSSTELQLPGLLRPHVNTIDAELIADGPGMEVTLTLGLWNPNERERELELLFPLGAGTTISGFEVLVDGRAVEGKLYPVEEARALHRQLLLRTNDTALLEHYGQALVHVRFPMEAQGTPALTLRYTRLIEPEGEHLSLHLPLTAFRSFDGPKLLTMRGEIHAASPVTTFYSPTNDVREVEAWTTWDDSGTPRYHSRFAGEATYCSGDSDFVALYKARERRELLDVTVLSQRPDSGEDGYFLAVINGVPPEVDEAAGAEPRNVVFVIDRSGSMKEGKLDQAREALKYMIAKLRPEDRFNVVSYAPTVHFLAATLQASGAKGDAYAYLDGLEPDGGTNIADALTAALGQFHDESQLNQIVFLTDGLPTEGVTELTALCRTVREANEKNVRLIAFGVGFDVNGELLDRLAAENRGLSEYVLPSEEIAQKVPGFYARMSTPLVLDAELALSGATFTDVFPRTTGDLYGGHQLLLTGRYADDGEPGGKLVITGRRGTQPWKGEYAFALAESTPPGDDDLVARIWATKKIGFLIDDLRLHGETDERIAAVVDLGTRFGILTEYTAFLAAEETDLSALAANYRRCKDELENRAKVTTGSHGVAQACNSKIFQRGSTARFENKWIGADGREVTVESVLCVKGRTFFKRGDEWLDQSAAAETPTDVIEVKSDAFYALADAHPWVASCVARTKNCVITVDGTTYRIVDGC